MAEIKCSFSDHFHQTFFRESVEIDAAIMIELAFERQIQSGSLNLQALKE